MIDTDAMEKTGTTIDAAGVAITVAGAATAFLAVIVRLSRRAWVLCWQAGWASADPLEMRGGAAPAPGCGLPAISLGL
jgi:hypothetical protein